MYSLIVKMAWRNSHIRPARTFLVILMISVSMSLMLGIQGLYDGMVKNMIEKSKRSGSGDVSIFAQGYRTEQDLKYRIKDAEGIKRELEKTKGVRAVTLRMKADGLASTARKSSFASIYGIDLQQEEKFGRFSEFLKEGEVSFERRGALIGLELAKRLKLKLGSKLVFSTQDIRGEINAVSVKVRGIVQTTNVSLDANAIFMDIGRVHKFLGTKHSEATHIALMLEDEKVYDLIQADYPDLDVKSFLQLQPMIQQMQDMMVIFNSITFLIVMSVVFVGILGVMYVSILDRIREFGILLGIGMEYSLIRLQIVMEAIFVGLAGYLSGAVLGTLFLVYLSEYGLDLSAFSDALEMWGYEAVIKGTIKLSYFTSTFLAIIVASLFSVLIPLIKIKRLNPIEVIKAEK